jgi:Ca2+-binding EF-hand superfamily protein
VLRQFEIRDATHSNAIEKGMLRSMFARLGIKVSASDVKGLSFCFEVPNRKHLFNYKDFLRVVESGF